MGRDRDEFASLYEEERWHASRVSWGERIEPDECGNLSLEFVSYEASGHSGDWSQSLTEAVGKLLDIVEEKREEQSRLEGLVTRVRTLEEKVEAIQKPGTIAVPITTFEPEPFDPLREIKAVIQQVDEDEYVATFFDANVNAAGCNEADAFANLKEMLLSRFEYLDSLPPEKLGPGPAKQIAVLRAFIRRRP